MTVSHVPSYIVTYLLLLPVGIPVVYVVVPPLRKLAVYSHTHPLISYTPVIFCVVLVFVFVAFLIRTPSRLLSIS